MQKCEFTETQFSFGFSFELIKHYPRLTFPIFPNTVAEGRAGGGWDVGFGEPNVDGSLFFQFKIPDYFDHWGWKTKGWSSFGKPFYRIEVTPHQFTLLKQLKRPANNVFYAAPEFFRSSSIINHFHDETICANSALFELGDFPAVLGDHKHIAYCNGENQAYLLSEPEPLKKRAVDGIFEIAPDRMPLSRKSEILRGIIMQATNVEVARGAASVFWTLFFRFNIIWLPILSPRPE